MIVNSIKNINYQKSINFKSCIRTYNGNTLNPKILASDAVKTSTNFFREDLNWNSLMKYILFNFINTHKVNTYSLACSDGSEAYSIAAFLMSKLPEKIYKKFFPITACDIDEKVLSAANKRRINIHNFEFARTNKIYHIDLNNYFINPDLLIRIKNDNYDEHQLMSYEPIDELKENILFKKSDILTELSQIKDEGNSIIFCRNVFPYLNEDYIDKVVKTASDRLKSGSLFIIGEFDSRVQMASRLQENGFFNPEFGQWLLYQKK